MKKTILLASTLSLLGTAVTPATVAFASEVDSGITFQASEVTVLDENNDHFMSVIHTIKGNGYEMLAEDLFTFFNGKVVTPENRDQLVREFEDFYNRRPQPRIAMSSVLATIAAAMAVTKGMYEAGRYAAKQLDTRGMLTKAEYKPNGGWWMAGITVSFGLPAALGFDDYMYNR